MTEPVNNEVEIITRFEKGKPDTYSLDGGKTFIDKLLVNNEWLDKIITSLVGIDEANDSELYNKQAEARQAILSKLESIEQEAKVDVWQEVDNLALGYRSYRMSDVAQERLRQLKGKG